MRELKIRVAEMDLHRAVGLNVLENLWSNPRFFREPDEVVEEHVKENPHYKTLLKLDPEKATKFLEYIIGKIQDERRILSRSMVIEKYNSEFHRLNPRRFEVIYGFKPPERSRDKSYCRGYDSRGFNSLTVKEQIKFIKKCDSFDKDERRFILDSLELLE